ncbi:TIGR04086 family membrane protein [Lachnotalea glycerini]|uniref:TIGR04086 family membrane protein n=2 Tax=Lachnotalea glycerini TaxID=1763509 RepID=A0A371JJ06_9FIRM|nr:TIGR04086 family membrane protein [Lachnotalea glycerini]
MILKCLLCSYIITGLALLLLALLVYKTDLDDGKVKVGITVIYIVASFIGGFILGKLKKENKFIWGAICGGAYFIILALVSLAVNHTIGNDGVSFFTVLVMCVSGGTFGGMVS